MEGHPQDYISECVLSLNPVTVLIFLINRAGSLSLKRLSHEGP